MTGSVVRRHGKQCLALAPLSSCPNAVAASPPDPTMTLWCWNMAGVFSHGLGWTLGSLVTFCSHLLQDVGEPLVCRKKRERRQREVGADSTVWMVPTFALGGGVHSSGLLCSSLNFLPLMELPHGVHLLTWHARLCPRQLPPTNIHGVRGSSQDSQGTSVEDRADLQWWCLSLTSTIQCGMDYVSLSPTQS